MSDALSPADRDRLLELFDRAAELPIDEQAAFIDRECGAASRLRVELTRLLRGLSGEDALARVQPGLPLSPGSRIGPYRLQRKLGEGGMGEVYAAEQLEPIARSVALKVIKPGMDSAQVVARFAAERRTLAHLAHEHIAQVLDAGTTADGRPYFAMELVDGATITDYSDRHALSTRARIELVLGVCEGVQHAHQKGIVHRDLKPSNILVTERDGRPVPKIIDFGIARAIAGSLAQHTLQTMAGQVVGTLDYMSPEQADPTGADIDTRSDIYSLGVVLYELLAGLLPFEHGTAAEVPLAEIQRVIREVDPPTPSTRLRRHSGSATAAAPRRSTDERTLIRQLSGDLDWICLKALEKEPARRYASASELAADLRRHLADEPVLAGPPSALYRARKFVRRNRGSVLAGAAILAALVLGVVGLLSGRLEAEQTAEEMRRLADAYRLTQLAVESDRLWPPHPDTIVALDALRRFVSSERATAAARGGFTANEDRSSLEPVSDRIAELDLDRIRAELLDADTPNARFGWSLAKRRSAAQRLADGFQPGGAFTVAWDAALPRIRERYGLPDLTPQMGLVPLGVDPKSKLEEFAHVLSGELPQRATPADRIVPFVGMCIVMVLVPRGDFLMGASTDPTAPNHDLQLQPDTRDTGLECGVPSSVTIDEPFFLSKFELTRDQWRRLVGTTPRELMSTDPDTGPLRPVDMVTWTDCARVALRLGLTVPDETQWEYAARAGTQWPWWTGAELASLEGAENLFDLSLGDQSQSIGGANAVQQVPWSDQFRAIAPVGTFRCNPWGLADVLGNASEWTAEPPYDYSKGRTSVPPFMQDSRVSRGGNARSGAYQARVTYRGYIADADFASPAAGVRFARQIDR
ncbi:MAG: bifunctional serine/threonine-protein kinase/formylglycine-generating enzyme family protein [Planctomycetota bacterium]